MQQDSNQKTIIIATLSFIVGFGLAWLIAANKIDVAGEVEKDSNVAMENEELTAVSGWNEISVSDQTEGVRVILDKVSFEGSGWAVVHEDDGAGNPGRILGAQLFDPVLMEQAKIDLLRGTLASQKYFVMLHSDNGDRAFDPKNDKPIMDKNGRPVMMDFMATAAPQE